MTHKGTIQDLLRDTAARFGERTALEQGRRRISYAELESRAGALRDFLLSERTPKESIVALLFESTFDLIVNMIGCLKAGCAFAPLDANYPEARLTAMLKHTAPRWIFTEAGFAETLKRIVGHNQLDSRVVVLETGDRLQTSASPSLSLPDAHAGDDVHFEPDSMCYVYFTSGSTGQPKAIAGRHKGLLHFIKWEIKTLGVDEEWRFSQLTPPSFDPFLRDTLVPLCAGATVCIPESRESVTDFEKLAEWIDTARINAMHIVPTLFRGIVNQQLNPHYFRDLKYVLTAGEQLFPAEVKRWFEAYGQRVQLVNLYGPTETTLAKFCHFITEADTERSLIPVGKPIEGARALILDEGRAICPPGTVGEIYIRTPFRSLGYLNQPELNEQVFIKNPFNDDPQDLIYRTGDLGRVLEDGNFELLGRKDQQVKVRGVRVELGEIEKLLHDHEAVRDAAVVDKEDNQKNKFLCAFVATDEELPFEQLRDFLSRSLPESHVPSLFVRVEDLPRSLNGKIDRRALRNLNVNVGSEADYVAPRSMTEERLSSLWQAALNLKRISVRDNFFRLGAHSLLATQVLHRINKEFQTELPLRSLFEWPTIETLAAVIDAARASAELVAAPLSPPILPQGRKEHVPLSYAQQRMWFVSQLAPHQPTYNLPNALRLEGKLSVGVLRRCFTELVRRHEILRTRFAAADGLLTQTVIAPRPFHLPIIDLSHLPHAAREKQLRKLTEEEARRPFNLESDELLRASLLRSSDEEHVLLLTMHHLVCDGWSVGVLIRELTELYKSFSEGRTPNLPALPIQYADFAQWQREWLAGEELESQLAYWKRELGDAPPVLELPTDRPRPVAPTFRSGTHFLSLPPQLSESLRQLSRREGVTLFMTLLAAFQTLLSRYSGQDDIVVGTPIANRQRPEIENLVGFFVNLLALRADLSGAPRFGELLRRVREVTTDAYAHQDVPFEKLIEALQPERSLNRMPLFQVMFVLQHRPEQLLELEGLKLSMLNVSRAVAQYDLTLALAEDPKGLSGFIEYNTDLFDETTVARLARHFRVLLEGIVADPEASIASLPLLDEEERSRLLFDWSRTSDAPLANKTLHELFEGQSRRTPDKVAVVFDDEEVTYAELNRRANQLAAYLRGNGVGLESVVGILMERSVEMLVAVLGVLKAGGAYLPLDAQYPSQRIDFMLEDAGASLLLTHRRLGGEELRASLKVTDVDAERESIAARSAEDLPSAAMAESLAYVIYTSGSTGRPKGTQVAHRGVSNAIQHTIGLLDIRPESRVIQSASLSFDASVLEIFMSLLGGASLHLVERETLLSGERLARFLRRQEISVWAATPSLLDALTEDDFPALEVITVGGEKCSAATAARWGAGGRRLFNFYAPTETTIYSTAWQYSAAHTHNPPVGRPISNTEVYILDARMQPVPVGVAGELHVGGAGLARGYRNLPALTAEKFIPHPFSSQPGARLYRTGDMARYLPGGEIEFLGRRDRQVKLRGYRIELGEVEAALAEHPQVRAAAVLVRGDETGNRRLVAYVAGDDREALAAHELRGYLREKLPEFMLPSFFVALDALPLTSGGKVDLSALPADEVSRRDPHVDYVAPRNEIEQRLAEIWQKLLGIEQVSIHDNFFELGGHSLLAMQVISHVREAFQIELPLQSIFERSTIAGLSEVVEEIFLKEISDLSEEDAQRLLETES